jgi:hypothetical protein
MGIARRSRHSARHPKAPRRSAELAPRTQASDGREAHSRSPPCDPARLAAEGAFTPPRSPT